jgi:hypothetical protein
MIHTIELYYDAFQEERDPLVPIWVILQYPLFFVWVWYPLKSQPLILINLILAVYLIKWVYLLPVE